MTPVALAVHPSVTYSSDSGTVPRQTPALYSAGSVPSWRQSEFFTRMARTFARRGMSGGTVLLHRDMWLDLGFPDVMPGNARFLDPLRDAGWKCSDRAYPTMSLHSHPQLPEVHFGPLHWITEQASAYPLIDPAHIPASLGLMAQWQQLSGVPYHGSPGTLAMAILRHGHARHAGTKKEPKWKPKHPEEVRYNCEIALNTRWWHTEEWGGHVPLEMLDTNRAYCSSYISCEVPRWGLTHTGRIAFDPRKAGYWLVQMEPWVERRMPHPAGQGATDALGRRWVTTPTLILLTKLTDQNVFGGFTIHDSYTSLGYQDLRPMGTTLKDIMYGDGVAPRIVATAKKAQQIVHGQFTTRTGRVTRPDWYATVIAYARSLLWIRAWRAAQTEGVWPVAFKTDAVYYRAGNLPGPTHFPRASSIGKFDPAKIRTLASAA